MAISFDNALGIHQYTVGVRERNAEVISTNIAQANTPHPTSPSSLPIAIYSCQTLNVLTNAAQVLAV